MASVVLGPIEYGIRISGGVSPPGGFTYLRPDGTSLYLRPDGTSIYLRP